MTRIALVVALLTAGTAGSPIWGGAASRSVDMNVSVTGSLGDVAGRVPEAQAIEACLRAYPGHRAAVHCIGTVAETCLKEAAADGEGCYRREADGWFTLVDGYHKRLERRYATDGRKLANLQVSQREWQDGLGRRCHVQTAPAVEIGSTSLGMECAMRESGRRALYLRILAQDANLD